MKRKRRGNASDYKYPATVGDSGGFRDPENPPYGSAEYRAKEDAMTLAQAEQIKMDRPRYRAAKKCLNRKIRAMERAASAR